MPHHLKQRTRSIVGFSPSDLIGVGLFFTPGAALLAWATFKGRGNTRDGLSRLLTEASAFKQVLFWGL